MTRIILLEHDALDPPSVAQLGRVCPVCRELDPETRAALGLDISPAAEEEAT